ncbi:MAG: bifunctional folylpolyglutamate synthase/dihydrofolate synthase [Hyphomonadaceae bacterium]|nr:bifunctional folylpolyglutamate synthase/dihydrofolate synthase [Hyphomonadaceae bacterium]
MSDSDSALEKALNELTRFHPRKIDLGLERIECALRTLDNPHLKLPPVVHVAGTNGKGSTVAFLRAIAEAQGLKAHAYTSPHLVRFNERIVVASEQIDDKVLIDVLERVRVSSGGSPLSFFEATTTAAFLAFSEAQADICIIEVGLGGRHDATNVIDHPSVCAITPIGYDHAEFLGRDLAGIAREKAGIMKWKVPVFVGPQSDLVSTVLDDEAARTKSPIRYWGQDHQAYTQNGRMVFEDDTEVMDLPLPRLSGCHQIMNAGLAVALAKHLQISRDIIAAGLETVNWPARLQRLTTGRLVDIVSKVDGELWLDGGHNPHAAIAVSAAMADMKTRQSRPLILVTGMLANKDIGGFLDSFAGLAQCLVGVSIPNQMSAAPKVLAELAKNRGLQSVMANTVREAITLIVNAYEKRDTPPRILICGSLFLAGEVLKENG